MASMAPKMVNIYNPIIILKRNPQKYLRLSLATAFHSDHPSSGTHSSDPTLSAQHKAIQYPDLDPRAGHWQAHKGAVGGTRDAVTHRVQ